MELFLRPAEKCDLDAVMQIYETAKHYDGCVWDEEYPNREIMLSDYENGGLYVYTLDNRIIGTISVIIDSDLEAFNCWKVQNGSQISFARIAIAEDFLNKGYGRRMVEELLKILNEKGYDSVQILVSPKNIAAMKIYKRLNFEFYRIEKVHGEDFYLCEKLFN